MTDALPLRAMTITDHLAAHAVGTPASALDAAARGAAKTFILDTLACAWAGTAAPGVPELQALLAEDRGRGDAVAWGFGTRLPATATALLNGAAAAALDYDPLGRAVPVHVHIAVLPAALAVAQKVGASGEDLIVAHAIGCDVAYRLALAGTGAHRGFSYTSLTGAFGAAAAGARLLGLSRDAARDALGLAYLQASGTQQANIEPCLAKRMMAGFGARAGTLAALMAARGITAPAEAVEGAFGLHALYQPGDPGVILQDLGRRVLITEGTLKKYPSCGCNHVAIEAMLALRCAHAIEPASVRRIRARISPYMDRIVGMEWDPSRDPQVAAQFSVRYTLACVLVRGRLGLAEIEADAAFDPAINALIPLVELEIEPSWPSDRLPVEIEVETTRGVFRAREDRMPGSPEMPMTAEEVAAKAADCFSRGVAPLSRDGQDRLQRRLAELEDWPDARTVLEGLT